MVKATIHCFLAGYAAEKKLDSNRSEDPLGSTGDFESAKEVMDKWLYEQILFEELLGETIKLVNELWLGTEVAASELLQRKTIDGIKLEILQVKVESALGLIGRVEAKNIVDSMEQLENN